MAKLVVQHKNREPQVFPLHKRETIIGRGDDTDLLLPDVSVSRRHCCVKESGDGYELRDLKSSNGTLLNGRKMLCKPLNHGDRIQVGKFLLSFESHAGNVEMDQTTRDLEKFHLDDERPGFLARISAIEGPAVQATGRLDAKSLKAARIAARISKDARIYTVGLDEKEYVPGENGISFGKKGIPVQGLSLGGKVRISWTGKCHLLVKEGGMMTRLEVNGNKVKSHELKIGDELTVGRSAFVYKLKN